ncbi:MAG TPA: DUF4124 domain-containing protein [Steroidobacteraceae bacterium]|nr:DUF4124 domain-containing protein [Steroidobacteraceae bacterium]
MSKRGRRGRVARIGGALLVLAAVVFTAGAIYKWVDKEGKVHYSDTPPPDAEAQLVRPDPAPTLEQRTQAQQRARALEDAQQAQRATVAAREDASRPVAVDPSIAVRRCADALVQRRTLDLQTPVYRRSGPGEFEYLADADRAAEKQKLDEVVRIHCSDEPAQASAVRQRFLDLSLGRRPACIDLRDELQERLLRGETSATEGVQGILARLQQFRCPVDVPVDGVWLAKGDYQLQPPR